AAGVEFTSVQLPGVDSTDYLAIHPESRTRAFFMTPAVRAAMVQGRSALHPLDYTGICRYLVEAEPFDIAVGQFTPPDVAGWCSPGLSPWLQTLWGSGSLDRDAQIVTGVVFGDASFYDYVGRLDRVRLEDVRSTHAVHSISQIPRFVAVNSAVEVDLFGQMNSERSDGSLQAGAGGLPAFAHAAQIAPQGRLLICLPATARGGKLSRI